VQGRKILQIWRKKIEAKLYRKATAFPVSDNKNKFSEGVKDVKV
jgi:hypothetical protein